MSIFENVFKSKKSYIRKNQQIYTLSKKMLNLNYLPLLSLKKFRKTAKLVDGEFYNSNKKSNNCKKPISQLIKS